jgi:POT family proton-dependent oligopeptide transporter
MLAGIYFILAQIPFWALFEQAGSSLNLLTDRLVDRSVFGMAVPAPVFQSLNSMYIILFAPVLAWLWTVLARYKLNPPTAVKFALGVAMAGFGFLSLVAGMKLSGSAGLIAVGFIFLIYWIHTIGELMVSPVGLSAVTKLAPASAAGMMMGAWFLYRGWQIIWQASSPKPPGQKPSAASWWMSQLPRPPISRCIRKWVISRWL